MRRAAILMVPMILAAPVSAQTFSLPQGCEGVATVQKRECLVSHLFTCEADGPGTLRRVDLGEEGMTHASLIDAETRWIESFSPATGATDTLVEPEADPASFTGLTATGRDTWDFEIWSSDGYSVRYVGYDRLTGETMVLDGVTLEQTEFEMRALGQDGAEFYSVTGNEWIVRDWRSFVSGITETTLPDETYTTDRTPVAIFGPGDAGFLTAEPTQDCAVMMSGLPAVERVSRVAR